jgi:hypothetical protein
MYHLLLQLNFIKYFIIQYNEFYEGNCITIIQYNKQPCYSFNSIGFYLKTNNQV